MAQDTDTAPTASTAASKTAAPSTAQASENVLEQAQGSQPGLVREFIDFLKHEKKWWLTPIVAVLILVTTLVMLSGTAGAPFIYTLW